METGLIGRTGRTKSMNISHMLQLSENLIVEINDNNTELKKKINLGCHYGHEFKPKYLCSEGNILEIFYSLAICVWLSSVVFPPLKVAHEYHGPRDMSTVFVSGL